MNDARATFESDHRLFTGATTLVALVCFALLGCRPESPVNDAAIDSQLFSRVQVLGARGTALGQFNKPRSVALDANDNLFVVDMTVRAQKFSLYVDVLSSWQMRKPNMATHEEI